jgi:hypothetical protein
VDGGIDSYTAEALEGLENFRSRCRALELEDLLPRYAALNSGLGERLERRTAELALAERLMGGLGREEAAEALREAAALGGADSPALSPSPEGTRYYFSREALEIFQNLKAAAEEDLAWVEDFFVRSGEGETGTFPELEALQAAAEKMTADLRAILVRGTEGAALAEEEFNRAEALRGQGDRFYEEARAAVGRGDFAGARLSIQRAAERYGQALSIQEFPSLREEWDTRMLDLGQEIAQG